MFAACLVVGACAIVAASQVAQQDETSDTVLLNWLKIPRDPGEPSDWRLMGGWDGALEKAQARDMVDSNPWGDADGPTDSIGGYPDRGHSMSNQKKAA
mmetsp:Transcript_125196/g.187019  ORF Transcript_125196/g.187019 Transcript_125196/m.187019 type:complete len:98 (+) Transcript_125196:1-294(+)